MATHDDWVTCMFCLQWQWVVDFERPNPDRRKVYVHDNGFVAVERKDAEQYRFYGRISHQSMNRLLKICATTYGHEFSNDTRYVFNRRIK